MPFCPQCNYPSRHDARFCNACGRVFLAADFAKPIPQPKVYEPVPFTPTSLEKKLLIGLLIFIVSGAIVAISLRRQIKDSYKKKAEETRQAANEKPTPTATPTPEETDPDEITIGKKPEQLADGTVLEVDRYLRHNLNDYSSAEYVEWSPVTKLEWKKQKVWAVRLKLRAKNAFGGYIIKNVVFFIQHGQVVQTTGL